MKEKELILLIDQAKEGKQLAFTKLYNKYYNTVSYVTYNIVRNIDVADDLTSVAFTKAFMKIEKYVDNISFEMWLKTIAINSSIDYIRRTKKENANYWLDDDTSTVQLRSSADYSPEDNYIFNETDARLTNAFNRLRYKYRYILELRTVQNMSYKQISEQLGLSESQVKSQLNKAREKLKQLLN